MIHARGQRRLLGAPAKLGGWTVIESDIAQFHHFRSVPVLGGRVTVERSACARRVGNLAACEVNGERIHD